MFSRYARGLVYWPLRIRASTRNNSTTESRRNSTGKQAGQVWVYGARHDAVHLDSLAERSPLEGQRKKNQWRGRHRATPESPPGLSASLGEASSCFWMFLDVFGGGSLGWPYKARHKRPRSTPIATLVFPPVLLFFLIGKAAYFRIFSHFDFRCFTGTRTPDVLLEKKKHQV